MPDRPQEMRTNGRVADPVFEEWECFYHRVNPAWIQSSDGKVDPAHVRCPNLSSNRSKYSQPFYVLYPKVKFGDHAVFKFSVQDVPGQISSKNPGGTPKEPPAVFDVRTVHVPLSPPEYPPEEDNYGHCETRVYRMGSDEPVGENKISNGAKKEFRVLMSNALKLDRAPGLNF